MAKPLIAANWKMHKTVDEAVRFAQTVKITGDNILDKDIVIAPPFTALYPMAGVLKNSRIHLSAQNLHWAEKGAYTGEVSAQMLVDAGCEYAIIGHSERRAFFGETDSTINKKIVRAIANGLNPVVCIGETLEDRDQERTFEVLSHQITKGLNNLASDDIRCCIIAYEPVWAIGTGKTATAQQAEEVHRFIRQLLADTAGETVGNGVRIIYGGSVTPDNISGLMAQPNINGALVGGASLEIESFAKIMQY